MAVTKIKPIKSTLSKALAYIQNPAKTEEKMLVSSFGCSYETADIEFAYTLSQALEKGNNLAHHLMQSFEPGEVSYEKAHEIGRQLADAVTKGQYEYVLTTHIDKGHIHNHVIFVQSISSTTASTIPTSGAITAYATSATGCAGKTACPSLSPAGAARERAMRSTKRKRRVQAGKAS